MYTCLVRLFKVPKSRRALKAHRLAGKTVTQQRHCAKSSVTNVLPLEQNAPQPTLLSIRLEVHEMRFEQMAL